MRAPVSLGEFLTVDELAVLLRVTPERIYKMRMVGKAPAALKLGRELRFERTAVDKWIAANTDTGRRSA